MIKIPKAVVAEMIDHAKKHYPQEACGFVVGKSDAAEYFDPIPNRDQSSVTYSMDSKQQMKAFKRMDEKGLSMIGIFHSHVASSAYPSQTDKQQAFYPEVSYLIVSLANMDQPDLKSFKIIDGQIIPEELVIQ
jgi:proteasome lid subunit RPN8/RPN11